MSPPSTTFEPASRSMELTASLLAFSSQTTGSTRATGALWKAFTPHRLVRRYSDYGWLNHSVRPSLPS